MVNKIAFYCKVTRTIAFTCGQKSYKLEYVLCHFGLLFIAYVQNISILTPSVLTMAASEQGGLEQFSKSVWKVHTLFRLVKKNGNYLENDLGLLFAFVVMFCRFSSLSQMRDRRDYLRERREERSQYMQRKKARYASSRKSRYFAHMDYATNSNRVGNFI